MRTAQEIGRTLGLEPVITAAIRAVNAGRGNGLPCEWHESSKKQKTDYYDSRYKGGHVGDDGYFTSAVFCFLRQGRLSVQQPDF